MKAGPRDRLITFKSITTTENDYGEPVGSGETTLGQEWAQIIYGKGEERRSAAYEGAQLVATFRTLNSSVVRSVGVADLIEFDGTDWDIVSIAPLDRDGYEFTASRRA